MKTYLVSIFFLLVATGAVAQQKALTSQYMTNYYLLNPAVAGLDKDWNFKTGYRNQWVGFEGAPKTFYLSAETALVKKGPKRKAQPFHGVGGYVYTDQTGPTTRTGALLSYAYHVPINRDIYLSSGVFAGFQQFRFNADKIHLAEGSTERDPVVMNGNANALLPDLSVGTILHAQDFYVGVSLFQALGNKIFSFDNADEPSRLARHLFVSAGYEFEVNRQISVEPSILLRYVSPAPVQLDFNVKGTYSFSKRRKTLDDDQIWAGLSYRTQDALVGMVGFHFLKQYDLAYSYDLTVSPMRHHSAGSHELTFGYRLKR